MAGACEDISQWRGSFIKFLFGCEFMAEKIEIHNRCLGARIKNITGWKIPDSLKKDIKKFLDELELGKVNRGKKISESRQTKYLDLLRTPLEFFGKEIEKVTNKDIETFERKLSKGEIKSKLKGVAYSHSTQVDMKVALKVFFRWKLGESKALELVGWLDTRDIKKTPEFLKEQEIEKLYRECKTKEQRFLIAVLFDSGARAEEFHNIRYEDMQLPEGNGNYAKITLKNEYSKTKGRTVTLFWRYSLEAVRDYVNQRIDEGIKPTAPIFNIHYDTARRFLYDIGKKVLKKSIHYHLFRHSSATYYADKMNRQQLCMRYGWAFSSEMPDTYISRAGIDEKELENKFTGTDISKIKDELEKEKQKSSIEIEKMKKDTKSLEEDKIQLAEDVEMLKQSDRATAEKIIGFLKIFESDPKFAKNIAKYKKEQLRELFAKN
jgi:integrase